MPKRIEVYDVGTGRSLGEVSEAQLRQLVDLFEEESETDRDYWIDADTLDLLAGQPPVDPGFVERLRTALGTREGFDLGWRELG
jgi:hypothetical protein